MVFSFWNCTNFCSFFFHRWVLILRLLKNQEKQQQKQHHRQKRIRQKQIRPTILWRIPSPLSIRYLKFFLSFKSFSTLYNLVFKTLFSVIRFRTKTLLILVGKLGSFGSFSESVGFGVRFSGVSVSGPRLGKSIWMFVLSGLEMSMEVF